ncbi:GH3 auxin-responsive promoter [Longimonas halophila]|uniref:GH3 auxin-responsive promoter n=1 Tax=Longimonas halophila TaxID=1469170 RepID=A0A2H3NQ35_9BACT|nr:GH3 auxin-responsive promoter family protein [Longimonas halophila]PEN09307.1 GH3 auxin-responsive promoter [Longimonas halophila]
MFALLRALLHRVGPLERVRTFLDDPVDTQRHLLRSMLNHAAATEWGQRYGFADIARQRDVVAAYQERVPLHSYDDLAADATRVREGAEDVMWPGRATHFAVSSGTVSNGKVLPVSQATIDANRGFSVGVGLHYLLDTHKWQYLLGRHLTLPGSVSEDPDYPGTYAGEVSGILAKHAPGFFKALYQAVPNEIAFLPSWEEKLRTIAERTVDQDIRLIVMVPSWAKKLFEHVIAAHNRRYDAHATTVHEVWPNLQLYISGGVALSSYRDQLEDIVGGPIDFIETYGASEGFFAFQNARDDDALLLHLNNGVFYEFVPMDEYGSANPTRHTIATVETDVRYALYVTSYSGLWSYDVGDVVQFTQRHPFKIEVAGRTSEMIDTFGEAIFADEVRDALYEACDATGASFHHYHVAPAPAHDDAPPQHEWIIEFDKMPGDLDAFRDTVDTYLDRVNRHYHIRRESDVMRAPQITAVAEGTFYAWLQATKDRISGQTKVPRMSTERTVAEGILRAQPSRSTVVSSSITLQ